MCSIVGMLYKTDKRLDISMGQALSKMMEATLHRGPDSAGWALYKEPHEGELRLRFFTARDEQGKKDVARIKKALDEQGAELIEDEAIGCTYAVRVKYSGDIQQFSFAMKRAAEIVSLGTRLDIIKDVGQPAKLVPYYHIGDFDGTHGLAHLRLATESGVYPNTTHPFWAPGFADICAIHNGMITNYWISRRRLEREGMEFQSNNDTELIAVYLAYKMSQGVSLEDALKSSLDDFDGTFSYLVSTANSIGFAKDKLASKPCVVYEDDDLIAICSEEVGLNALFPGKALDTTEMPPYTYGLWSLT
jgi:glutamate synthase domain-containing protein 1